MSASNTAVAAAGATAASEEDSSASFHNTYTRTYTASSSHSSTTTGHKRPRESHAPSSSSSTAARTSWQRRHEEIYKAVRSESEGFLPKWFREEEASATYELEVRFPDVDKKIFDVVFEKLSRNRGWSWTSEGWTESIDKFFPGRKRATFEQGKEPVIISKDRLYRAEDVLVDSLDRKVRFSLQNERHQTLDGDEGEPTLVRKKKRYTFIHKGEIKYEFTQVDTSGSSQQEEGSGDATHEIEIEWCGKHKKYSVEMCVQKLLFKVVDMLMMIHDATKT